MSEDRGQPRQQVAFKASLGHRVRLFPPASKRKEKFWDRHGESLILRVVTMGVKETSSTGERICISDEMETHI